jgi:transcriptional regulator with XRE-family HTH domain
MLHLLNMRRGRPAFPSAHPLRVWRLAQGLTCTALAAQAGTTEASISRIERGRQQPSSRLIRRLRATTQLAVADFYEWHG